MLLICIFILAGCKIQRESASANDANAEKLVVYMNATPHTFLTKNEGGEEEYTTLYPSKHVIGTMLVGGEIECPNGNIFEGALKEYEQETGIEIEVHYLEEYDLGGDVLQDLWDHGQELPDLLLLGKQPQYDYYRLAQQEMLLDFSEYMANDEQIQDKDRYYQAVIDGGKMLKGQYALPILFNMNGMITTSSFLKSIGRAVPEEEFSYEEILELLKAGCIASESSKECEAIFEASGYRAIGQYIPSILTGAAYPQYLSDSLHDINVSPSVITSIFDLMEYYNQQEFCSIDNWQSQSYATNIYNDRCKSLQMELTKDLYERIGIFLTGGRSGGVGFHNSLLTDVAFFDTVYKDGEEEMVFRGVPTEKSSDYYAANISLAAFGLQSTKYPEEVYKLIRYLMDYEFPMAYGFAVNQELTEKQLEDVQNTTVEIRPEAVWEGFNFGKTLEELQNEIEYVKPLSAEHVETIRNMLNHIAGAGLPYGILEYNMYTSMLNMVGDNQMSPQKASEWIMDEWEEYLSVQNQLEPFYDEKYLTGTQLAGN